MKVQNVVSNFKKKVFFSVSLVCLISNGYTQPILIKAKQYLDVRSGKLIKPANILIDKKKIIAINPVNIPNNSKVINKENLILLPGLMDMHVHLTFNLDKNYELKMVQNDASMMTLEGVKNSRILIDNGFTTVRDLGQAYAGNSLITVALANASELGWIKAPHIIASGHAIGITGGHMDWGMIGPYQADFMKVDYRAGIADGVDEVVKATRYQIKYGAKVIKIGATAGIYSHGKEVGEQQLTNREMKAIVDEAKRHDVYVAAHAHGAKGIKNAIRAGVRSIEHGSLLDEQGIKLMKHYGTYFVPTAYIAEAIDFSTLPVDLKEKAQYLLPKAKKNLSKAIKAGVKIAYGTDAPVIPFKDNNKEFFTLVKRGMTPIQAIQTATINSAEMMSITDRGEIKKGLLADLIGIECDPLAKIRCMESVKFVMLAGKVVIAG